MVRVDEAKWVKGGMDVGGVQQVSAVVTREYSDWSVAPLPSNPAAICLRLTRYGLAIEIHYALDSVKYQMFRLAGDRASRRLDVASYARGSSGDLFLPKSFSSPPCPSTTVVTLIHVGINSTTVE